MKNVFVEVRIEEKFPAPLHAIPAAEPDICLCAKSGNKLDRHAAVREGDDIADA